MNFDDLNERPFGAADEEWMLQRPGYAVVARATTGSRAGMWFAFWPSSMQDKIFFEKKEDALALVAHLKAVDKNADVVLLRLGPDKETADA